MRRHGNLSDSQIRVAERFLRRLAVAGVDGNGMVGGRDQMYAAGDLFAEVEGKCRRCCGVAGSDREVPC
jgi:hypothetical protein